MYQDYCPVAEKPIQKILLFGGKKEKYCIYEPENDLYYMCSSDFGDFVIWISTLSDGKNSIGKMEQRCEEEKKNYKVLDAVSVLVNMHVIKNIKGRSSNFSEIKTLSKTIYTKNINLPSGRIKKLFLPFWLTLLLLFFATGVFLLAAGTPHRFAIRTIDYGTRQSLLYYLLSLAFLFPVVMLHELAHILTASRYGLQAKYFKISLYFFIFPMFYIKIAGIYTLKMKERIAVLAAGLLSNLIIGGIFYNVFRLTGCYIFLSLALSNLQLVLTNILPLNLTDGYFIFTNLCKEANLRKSAFLFMKKPNKRMWREMNPVQRGYTIISMAAVYAFIHMEAYILLKMIFLQRHTIIVYSTLIISNLIFAGYLFVIHVRMKRNQTGLYS